jgi:hypothetical protein
VAPPPPPPPIQQPEPPQIKSEATASSSPAADDGAAAPAPAAAGKAAGRAPKTARASKPLASRATASKTSSSEPAPTAAGAVAAATAEQTVDRTPADAGSSSSDEAARDATTSAAAAADSDGGGGGGVLGRLSLLNKLRKGQRAKGSDAKGGGAAKGASAAARAAAAAAPSASTPRAAEFGGAVAQHRLHGWVLQGCDDDLRALGERLPGLQGRLTTAVRAEQAEQERELRRLYASSSLERLRQDGVLLYPLRAAPQAVELGQMIWKLTGSRGEELRQHKFKAGDSVLIRRHVAGAQQRQGGTRSDGDDSGADQGDQGEAGPARIAATVQSLSKRHVLIAMDKLDSDRMQAEISMGPSAGGVDWRMDAAENDATTKRQLEAIKRLNELQVGRSLGGCWVCVAAALFVRPPPAGSSVFTVCYPYTGQDPPGL